MGHPPYWPDRAPAHYPQFDRYQDQCDELAVWARWVAGWVDWLLHDYGPTGPHPDRWVNYPFERFFHPSDVIAHQQLKVMHQGWLAIDELRYKSAGEASPSLDVLNNLDSALGAALGRWEGDVAVGVQTYREELENYTEPYILAVGKLGQCLIAYSQTFEQARADMVKVMKQFVGALQAETFADPEFEQLGLTMFDVIGNWVLGKFPFAIDKILGLDKVLAEAVQGAQRTKDPAAIGGGNYWEICDSYLVAANGICDDARAAITKLTARLDNVDDELRDPPQLNVDVNP
ncbi:hypothetical protein DL990_30335 [Amycolatopsis sp. WAC 01416]|uniref:hypothetical protein n=1 Tax=Amycolatopsis sp. WAC 01416 TaxID=2203196 RepID=UPI000F78BAB1|nr:hypothetical protein [Amycolatopsis sp. WAC 01416]RSN27478.1 hypothetical protein DL990_30335 [Amycolatopsis sp. WAC 01416]